MLAVSRGVVSFDEIARGLGIATRLGGFDHVTRVTSNFGTTYWKAGPGIAAERRAFDLLTEAGLHDLRPWEVSRPGDLWLGTLAASGRSLGEVESGDARNAETFVKLGAALRSLDCVGDHSVESPASFYMEPKPDGARMLSSGQIAVLARVQSSRNLRRVLSSLKDYPTTFSHGDARPENIFVCPDTILLIDWELAGNRWVFFDVATAIAHIVWRWMIPGIAEAAQSWEERAERTAASREAIAQLLRGYKAHEVHSSPGAPIAYAFIHMGFEAAAMQTSPSAKVELLLGMAELLASKDDEWRCLLLPFDS